jgi:hypothetical protein
MSMEFENMELLRKHECRKFYKKTNVARKKFKPGVNIYIGMRMDH